MGFRANEKTRQTNSVLFRIRFVCQVLQRLCDKLIALRQVFSTSLQRSGLFNCFLLYCLCATCRYRRRFIFGLIDRQYRFGIDRHFHRLFTVRASHFHRRADLRFEQFISAIRTRYVPFHYYLLLPHPRTLRTVCFSCGREFRFSSKLVRVPYISARIQGLYPS